MPWTGGLSSGTWALRGDETVRSPWTGGLGSG